MSPAEPMVTQTAHIQCRLCPKSRDITWEAAASAPTPALAVLLTGSGWGTGGGPGGKPWPLCPDHIEDGASR